MSSLLLVKYVQPNSLIVNINENIDEVNRKIIPKCTLKHSNQKENVLILIGKFKTIVTNILYQLDQKEADYNLINFDELNDSLEKAYKLLLDEIVLPYEKIDLTDITNQLNKLEGDIKKISVVLGDLNIHWGSVKTNADKVPNLVSDLYGLNDHMNYFDNVLDPLNEEFPQLKQQLTDLKEEVKNTVVVPVDLNTEWESVKSNANKVP
jgi:predicted  nucleic acid-binding Zn-ribbon protein